MAFHCCRSHSAQEHRDGTELRRYRVQDTVPHREAHDSRLQGFPLSTMCTSFERFDITYSGNPKHAYAPVYIRMESIALAHPEVVDADHTTIKRCQPKKQKSERVVKDAAVINRNKGETVDIPYTS